MAKTKYFRITEKELLKLKSATDTLYAMSGTLDEDFNNECQIGKQAIDSILKRAGLQRVENEFQTPHRIENPYQDA